MKDSPRRCAVAAAPASAALPRAGSRSRRRGPTFKSTVDLVPVDVNVVDKNGRPVADLTAEDFTLAVDGKPRRIASAQFISVDRATVEPRAAKPVEYTSNAGAPAGGS